MRGRPAGTRRARRRERVRCVSCSVASERMGAVGADRELELEERLVGGDASGIAAAAELAPELGELARPERQEDRLAAVVLRLIVRVRGPLGAGAREPALGELVLARHEPASGRLPAVRLVAAAPEELAADRRGAVEAALERLPPERRIDGFESRVARDLVRRLLVRAVPVGEAELEVARIRYVAVRAVVRVVGEIAAMRRGKEALRVAPED